MTDVNNEPADRANYLKVLEITRCRIAKANLDRQLARLYASALRLVALSSAPDVEETGSGDIQAPAAPASEAIGNVRMRSNTGGDAWVSSGDVPAFEKDGWTAISDVVSAPADYSAQSGDKYRLMLLDLLAVIHRDGGHRTQELGVKLSNDQAMQRVSEWILDTRKQARAYLYEGGEGDALALLKALVPPEMTDREKVEAIFEFIDEPTIAPPADLREAIPPELQLLSNAATPGTWNHYNEVFRPRFGQRRITEIQSKNGKAIVNWGGFDGLPDATRRRANANAAFIVAAVNYVRAALARSADREEKK